MSTFCNFCYNSGRGDFDDHNIRSRYGKLTCKYLANILCTKCGERGHTIKYCRSKNINTHSVKTGHWIDVTRYSKNVVTIKKANRRLEPNTSVISNLLGGAFSALGIDDDSSPSSCVVLTLEKNLDRPTVTISWATKSNPIYSSLDFNKVDMRSWADMVDDDYCDE